MLYEGDQTILADWYSQLIYKGLNWNLQKDLCGQTGVTCDESNPQRVTELYFFLILS